MLGLKVVGVRRDKSQSRNRAEVDRLPWGQLDLERFDGRVDDLEQKLRAVALHNDGCVQPGGGQRRVQVARKPVRAVLHAVVALVIEQATRHRVGKAQHRVDCAVDERNINIVEEAAATQVVEFIGQPPDQADNAGGVDVAKV